MSETEHNHKPSPNSNKCIECGELIHNVDPAVAMTTRTKVIIWAVIAVIGIFIAIGMTGGDTSTNNSNTNNASTNETQEPTSTLAISESDAEVACQDANITLRYTDANNVSLIDIWNYNAQYSDNGDGTANLRWNGKDKDSDSTVFFDCDLSKDGENVRVTKLTAVVDNIRETIID